MDIHQHFYTFLEGLPNGDQMVAAYRRYKSADGASAFELNGRLKAGLELAPEHQEMSSYLKRSICARTRSEITLYRMTGESQFLAPVLDALEGDPIRYLAFMSSSRSSEKLHTFVPSPPETPLILEITCPPGTFMALLEAHPGAAEDEYLLGCGTSFEVLGPVEVLDDSEATAFAGYGLKGRNVKKLRLRVHKSPPYTNQGKAFDF